MSSVFSPIFLNSPHRQDSHQGGIHPFPASLECIWPEGQLALGGGRAREGLGALWALALSQPASASPEAMSCAGPDRRGAVRRRGPQGRCRWEPVSPGRAAASRLFVYPLQSVPAPEPTPLRPRLTPVRPCCVHGCPRFCRLRFATAAVGPLSPWRREAGARSCRRYLRSGRRHRLPPGGGPRSRALRPVPTRPGRKAESAAKGKPVSQRGNPALFPPRGRPPSVLPLGVRRDGGETGTKRHRLLPARSLAA